MPFVAAKFDSMGSPTISAQRITAASAQTLLPQIQSFAQKQYGLRSLRVGRLEEFELWAESAAALPTPRFTLQIVDVANRNHTGIQHRCVVFFIPQGRENEWMFCTEEGLKQVAESAKCCRLIAVRCNRGHEFGDTEQLKAELSPIVLHFTPDHR